MKALTVSWDYEKIGKYIIKVSYFLIGTLSGLHACVEIKSNNSSSDTADDETSNHQHNYHHNNHNEVNGGNNDNEDGCYNDGCFINRHMILSLGESGVMQIKSEKDLEHATMSVNIFHDFPSLPSLPSSSSSRVSFGKTNINLSDSTTSSSSSSSSSSMSHTPLVSKIPLGHEIYYFILFYLSFSFLYLLLYYIYIYVY